MFSAPSTADLMPTIQRSRNLLELTQYMLSAQPILVGRRATMPRVPTRIARIAVWASHTA